MEKIIKKVKLTKHFSNNGLKCYVHYELSIGFKKPLDNKIYWSDKIKYLSDLAEWLSKIAYWNGAMDTARDMIEEEEINTICNAYLADDIKQILTKDALIICCNHSFVEIEGKTADFEKTLKSLFDKMNYHFSLRARSYSSEMEI